MTSISIEEELLTALEITAKRKLTTAIVKEALQRYLQSEVPPPKKYSFIGIGHSGKKNISTQVEETLATAANRIEGWSLPE